MIQTSGFFGPMAPLPDAEASGLECLHESASGPCLLLKGHRNDRIVVYKVLKAGFRDDPVYQRMLRREYEIGVSLKHPGICETLAWRELPGYGDGIELEWIDGCRLDEWLASHPGDSAQCRQILADLCDALAYLHHKQVIHKDLKPENILITRLGGYVKIIDFGLSDTDSILTGKDPGGTRGYAAPEVLSGKPALAVSDIYSLGRIMQQMGPAFSRIARKCTATDIGRRYASAEEVRRDLLALRLSRRHTWIVSAALLVLLALGAGYFLHRGDPVRDLFLDAVEQVRQAATPT